MYICRHIVEMVLDMLAVAQLMLGFFQACLLERRFLQMTKRFWGQEMQAATGLPILL